MKKPRKLPLMNSVEMPKVMKPQKMKNWLFFFLFTNVIRQKIAKGEVRFKER